MADGKWTKEGKVIGHGFYTADDCRLFRDESMKLARLLYLSPSMPRKYGDEAVGRARFWSHVMLANFLAKAALSRARGETA